MIDGGSYEESSSLSDKDPLGVPRKAFYINPNMPTDYIKFIIYDYLGDYAMGLSYRFKLM